MGQARRRDQVSPTAALLFLGSLIPDINQAALVQGGAVPVMLNRPDAILLADWINPNLKSHSGEHAMGFMQFLPSTWREYASAHSKPTSYGGGP